MTLTDPIVITTALGLLGTLGGTGSALAVYLRGRGASAVAREQGAADALPHVMERLTRTESRLDRAEQSAADYARLAREAKDAADRCHEERAAEADHCEERIADVEMRMATEISALRTSLEARDEDVTRRVRLEVRRSLTPRSGHVVAERTPRTTIREGDGE